MWLKTEPQNIFLRKYAYFFESKAELSIFWRGTLFLQIVVIYISIFWMYFLEKEEMKYTTQEKPLKIFDFSRER